MNKKVILFLLAGLSFLAGCSKKNNEKSITITCEAIAPSSSNDPYGIMDLPLGMKLSIKETNGYVLTLEIDNQSGYEMTYTEDFSLQVLNRDKWEEVPQKDGAIIIDAEHVIEDLEKQTLEYDLEEHYGALPNGTYLLSQEDMSVTFNILR